MKGYFLDAKKEYGQKANIIQYYYDEDVLKAIEELVSLNQLTIKKYNGRSCVYLQNLNR